MLKTHTVTLPSKNKSKGFYPFQDIYLLFGILGHVGANIDSFIRGGSSRGIMESLEGVGTPLSHHGDPRVFLGIS